MSSSQDPDRERRELVRNAMRCGMNIVEAQDWAREQLKPKHPRDRTDADQTAALFPKFVFAIEIGKAAQR